MPASPITILYVKEGTPDIEPLFEKSGSRFAIQHEGPDGWALYSQPLTADPKAEGEEWSNVETLDADLLLAAAKHGILIDTTGFNL